MARIYTRTGDDGTSALISGTRLPKSAPIFDAIGAIDEVNAALGVAIAHADGPLRVTLQHIQHALFDLGVDLASMDCGSNANPQQSPSPSRIGQAQIMWLEQQIDTAQAELPPLRQFILPGGSVASAHIHMARTIARRAERVVAALDGIAQYPHPAIYLNRLSDLLFVLARLANNKGADDVIWQSATTGN